MNELLKESVNKFLNVFSENMLKEFLRKTDEYCIYKYEGILGSHNVREESSRRIPVEIFAGIFEETQGKFQPMNAFP